MRWNLKEAVSKSLVRRTEITYKARLREISWLKARRTKKQVNVENQAIKLLSKEELIRKIEVIKKELRSYTWRDLETNGKFAKNDKLSFITDDMLIAECDIGSETHYIRAIDVRSREITKGANDLSKTSEGFANAKTRMQALAAKMVLQLTI